MSNVRIEFNDQGFRELLQSGEVQQLVLNKAEEIAGRANSSVSGSSEGFRAHAVKAPSRWIAFAGTSDDETIRAEAEDKVLSRAVY